MTNAETFLETLERELRKVLPAAKIKKTGSSLYLTDDSLVGQAKITDRRGHAFIDQIFIVAAQRRCGLGSALLSAVGIACQAHNYKKIGCFPTEGGETLNGVAVCSVLGFKPRPDGLWFKDV